MKKRAATDRRKPKTPELPAKDFDDVVRARCHAERKAAFERVCQRDGREPAPVLRRLMDLYIENPTILLSVE